MTSPIIPTNRQVTLVSRAARGGHPRYCAELANALHKEGATVRILEPAVAFEAHAHLHSAEVENVPISEPDAGWFRQEREIASHLIRARKTGGTVVFQDTSPIRVALIASLRLIQSWTPVSMVHNTEPHDRSGRERVKHLAALAALIIPHRVLVHNERQRTQLGQRPLVSAKRVDIVPHGAWTSEIEHESTRPKDRSIVLMFGVMRHNSGLGELLAAAPTIARTLPHCTIRVVGSPSSSDVSDQLDALATCDPFDVRSEYVSDDDADRLFTEAAWVLLPYTDYVSESGVLVMAVTNGLPVITFGSTSVADRVRELGLGPTPQPTLLATLEMALNCDDTEYDIWAGNSRAAQEVFSWEEHARRILEMP